MTNKTIILVAGVILVFLFYWFQIRPAGIRSSCMQRFYDLCQNSTKGYDSCVRILQTQWSTSLDRAYKGCLHEKGI